MSFSGWLSFGKGPLRLAVRLFRWGRRGSLLALLVALVAAGCGGGDESPPPGVPNVVGLALPDAKAKLKRANYASSEKATDALFGVIIESNFVVCKQSDPNGRMVPLEVAKHGCEEE
jgi:hypothetical protein